MVLESGTSQLDHVALNRKIGSETGGLSTSFHSDAKRTPGVISKPDDVVLYFILVCFDDLLFLLIAILLLWHL